MDVIQNKTDLRLILHCFRPTASSMKFVIMKTQNATPTSDQSDVRAPYSCTERESRLFLCHAEAVFWLVIRWSWFWWKMAVDWVQDLQPWQLSSKMLLNYTAHERLESDFSSQCCWAWLVIREGWGIWRCYLLLNMLIDAFWPSSSQNYCVWLFWFVLQQTELLLETTDLQMIMSSLHQHD